MKLLYGTGNKSKLRTMRDHVAPLGIELTGLDSITMPLPEIDESGTNPLENARIKAMAYYATLKTPVFSCDSGMYINGLPPARQPGVHVRRVNGCRLTDDEMIAHYSAIAAEFGGYVTAQYRNAICLVLSETEIYEHDGDDIASEKFLIAAKPHRKRSEGFPIDSLSVHIDSGRYYYDLGNYREKYFGVAGGFEAFFRRGMGLDNISAQ